MLKWRATAAFAIVVALGLFFRLWGLSGESVWFDEFVSLILLKAPDAWTQSPYFEQWNQTVMRQESPGLAAFVSANHSLDPATMPAYPALQYLWNRYVNASPFGLRVISVAAGMLIVLLVYFFARDMYGPQAGYIAALCVALSPVHRYFSQEIRMYVFTALLALLSAYALFRALRNGGRRWWVIHAIANLLLPWTHIFGLLIPAVEGLYLVSFHRTPFRRLLVWGGVHVLLFVPVLLYIRTLNYWSEEQTSSWRTKPGWVECVSDLLADDAAGLTHQIRANPAAFDWFLPAKAGDALVQIRQPIGVLWMGAVVACAAWVLVRAWRRRTENWAVFLALWWLLPPLLLYIASSLWRPCVFPRYTLYSSFALYILLGGAIAGTSRKALRTAAFALLAAFFVYQDMLVLGEPQRTDWHSAGAYVKAHARPDDLIVVEDSTWKRVFAFNLGPVENVIACANEPGTVADMASFILGQGLPSKHEPPGPRGVWAVAKLDYFKEGGDGPLEAEFKARHFTFERSEFLGYQHVNVYRLERTPGAVPLKPPSEAATELGEFALDFWHAKQYDAAVAACRHAIEADPGYSRAYTYMAMALKDLGKNEEALKAFREAVRIKPDDYLWNYSNIAALLTEQRDYDGALAACRAALAIDPKFAPAYTRMGQACLEKGDIDASIEAFKKAAELDPGDMATRTGLEDALARKGQGR